MPRGSDEWFTLAILVGPGRFANKANIHVQRSDTENGLRSRRSQFAASGASLDFLRQHGESHPAIRRPTRHDRLLDFTK